MRKIPEKSVIKKLAERIYDTSESESNSYDAKEKIEDHLRKFLSKYIEY